MLALLNKVCNPNLLFYSSTYHHHTLHVTMILLSTLHGYDPPSKLNPLKNMVAEREERVRERG